MSRKTNGAGFLLIVVVVVFAALTVDFNPTDIIHDTSQAAERPNDWFGRQRAYPNDTIPMDRVTTAINTAREMRRTELAKSDGPAQPRWTQVGPTNVPGRVLAVDVHPSEPNTIYIGSAMGGVHKSIDRGRSWIPIFDEVGILPIGAIEIDPTDPQTIYVGTGEAGPLHYFLLGNGVYKSTSAGETWEHIGLADSGTVGRIIVDPQNPDRVFVAAAGRLMKGPDDSRGLYRSEDGGATWERVLYINPDTGIADLAFHSQSGIMLASAWEYRWGYDSGIWRSEDRGETWTHISGTGGLPARSTQHRKITLTIGSTHTTAYAAYCGRNRFGTGRFEGLWRSDDLGVTWRQVDNGQLEQAYSHSHWPYSSGSYFGGVQVSPTNPEVIFVQGVSLWRSRNGGASWDDIYGAVGMNTGLPHIDHHDLCFLPEDDDVFYLGCDGGVWYTEDQGDTWEALDDLANTQFYRIEIDFLNPWRIYGGSQDNGTIVSPTGSPDDWHMIQNGDGGPAIVDHTNSDIVYVTWFGFPIYKSTNGGASFREVMNGIDPSDSSNIEVVPLEMDAHDPRVLYFGTNRVYRSTTGAEYWQPISPTLTQGWSFLTAIGLSSSDNQVVYAGGATGEIWVTTNGGGSWNWIDASLPNRWVTRVAVDPEDAAVAYVTLSGYEMTAITTPHIYRTTDYGETWTDISSNLPDAPINDVIVDPFRTETLYVGTDVGVFRSNDLGAHWTTFGSGMPINVVTDLDYHPPTRMLVAGTYGRSIFKTTTEPTTRRAPRRVRPTGSSRGPASKGRG